MKKNVRPSRPLAKYNGYNASHLTVRSTKRASTESTDILGNWSWSNCSDKTVCQLCYKEDIRYHEDEDIDWAQCDNQGRIGTYNFVVSGLSEPLF